MARYLLRRTIVLALSLVVAGLVLFVLLRLLPGDPAAALLSVGADEAQIAAAREQVGSDQPIWVQFGRFLSDLARFDLGVSFVSNQPVLPEIMERLAITLPLTVAAFLLAIAIAVPLGILAAVRADRWYGVAISGLSQLGLAIPVFWIGILLVWLVAVEWRLLPASGFPMRGWADPVAAGQSLILPIITIAVVMSASLLRYVRSATLDVLDADYLRNARALGESFPRALIRHGIRNGAVPVISILGIELASTLLGAVVVERVFSLPGLGSMLLLGIEQRDYPSVQGVLLITTLLVLLIGFAADILQRMIDPRLRDNRGSAR
ncbi:peptide/nickel transport system permease protein [Paracoccus isoporae]|uniref:Peptide/nickel transport system permease protein n=1 Tax=Paracoccus isoporae TaxID=591205 RepID=A0A1G7CHP5_9RHOB|nr:ABC transporter permease [Paracoccus isoporae]SDE38914.1 peptide/nickel transport system permease protein [Paracoccus isoporae]